MIKAIFFDIDGTLIDFETHSIPESTLQTLHKLQAKGVKLCIASGRPPVQLPLLGDVFNSYPWDGYILLNGQYCMDEHRERFYDCPISPDTFKTLVPYLKTVDYACNVFELEKGYMTKMDEGTYMYYKSIGKLDRLLEIGAINIVQYLQNLNEPFADKLLQDVQSQVEDLRAQQAEMGQQAPQNGVVPGADQEAVERAQGYLMQ